MSGGATPATRVWLALFRAARAVETCALGNIKELGFCYTDFAVLEALLHKGPLPVNVIGRKVLLTSGSITAAVDRLEARGLVERRADASDRRARIVHLAPEGETLIRESFPKHAEALESAVEGLSDEERATLVRLLLKLTQA